MAKQTKNILTRDLTAVLLLLMSTLLGCSFISYSPFDLSFIKTPPSSNNWIGPTGAYLAYAMYSVFGWSANLIPLVATSLSLMTLFRKDYRPLPSLLLMLGFILSVACLTQVFAAPSVSWNLRHNTPFGIGGVWGLFIGEKLFWKFLKHGTVIIFLISAVACLYFSLQVDPREVYDWCLKQWAKYKQKSRAKALRSGDLKTVLRTREEEIAERQKHIAKELIRHGRVVRLPQSKSSRDEEGGANIPAFTSTPSLFSDDESNSIKAEERIAQTIRPQKPKALPRTAPKAALPTGPYEIPSTSLLQPIREELLALDSREEIATRGAIIEATLREFGIEVRVGEITQGATITRFEVIPSPGIKVERIVNLASNLTLALKAERVNILAPVAGKGTVGIEVANSTKASVLIRELLESAEFQHSKAKIPLALGKDVYGKTLIADLSDMPHLLIAGSTGSGKSVCINSILTSLLYRFSPDDLRLILIDPKVVELQVFNALPHLVVPVVSDPKKVIVALRWVVREMEKRYGIMAKVGVRNIASFNARIKKEKASVPLETENLSDLKKAVENAEMTQPLLIPEDEIIIPDRMPYIVVIVDELADLMLTAPVDAEDAITRITQMARAAGIHLIVATQTPRADIVTGTIKTNLPSKISFRVASKIDSRVILDENGAENLLGKGDMIYKPSDSSTLSRAQGAYIADEEVRTIVDFCSRQIPTQYDTEIHEKLSKRITAQSEASDEDEELVEQCIQVIRQEGRASTSLLQRRLRLGYTRAARIMDILEERGIVGESQGAKDREILIPLEGSPKE
jgi:S-DNA-T family DNA segregation ATPase FtsK/SpoIIIE